METRVGKLEVTVGTILTRLDPIEAWVDDSKDFHRDMRDFKATLIARQDALRDEQNRKHRENSMKLNLVVALIGFGTLIITALGVFIPIYLSHHASLTLPKISVSSPKQDAYNGVNSTDAGNSAAYTDAQR